MHSHGANLKFGLVQVVSSRSTESAKQSSVCSDRFVGKLIVACLKFFQEKWQCNGRDLCFVLCEQFGLLILTVLGNSFRVLFDELLVQILDGVLKCHRSVWFPLTMCCHQYLKLSKGRGVSLCDAEQHLLQQLSCSGVGDAVHFFHFIITVNLFRRDVVVHFSRISALIRYHSIINIDHTYSAWQSS